MSTAIEQGQANPRWRKPPAISRGFILWTSQDAVDVNTALTFQWGTGAPTHTAASGSLWYRTDAADSDTTWYRNTDGAATWETIVGSEITELLAANNVWTGTNDYGVDGTGVDVTFYGDTASRHLIWDMSADTLRAQDSTSIGWGSGAGTTPDIAVAWSGTQLNVTQLTVNSAIHWGVSGAGIDQVWYGDTVGADATWDQSADSLTLGAGASVQFADSAASPAVAGELQRNSTNLEFHDGTGARIMYMASGQDVAVADGGTGASSAADARTNLGLVIGTDVQAYDAGLADIAGLAVTDGGIIVGDGANFVLESGATARTSLGLGTGDSPTFAGLKVTGDLALTGSAVLVDAEHVSLRANYQFANMDYVTAVGQTSGIVANYLPTATADTTTGAGVVTAGVDAVSDPTITTVGAATFAATDIVMISGSANDGENDGLYEVASHAANVLTLKSTSNGVSNRVEDFTLDQLTANAGDVGMAITKVTVTVMRTGSDGVWEVGSGAQTGISYSNLVRASDIGSTVQAYDADLDAVAGLAATGIVARTGAGTAAARTLTAPAAGITVADGDGVAGNPTLALANDLAALEGLATTGHIVRTGDGAATTRSVAVGSASLTVVNGDGVAGNPTLDTAQNIQTSASPTFAGLTLSGNVTSPDGHTIDMDNQIQRALVTVAATEIRDLVTNQKTLVAAPAGGLYLEFVSAHLFLDFVSVAHDDAAADGNLVIRYTDGSGTVIATEEADGLIDAVADAHRLIPAPSANVTSVVTSMAPTAAAAIVLDNDGAEFSGTGDSPLLVEVLYRVRSFTLAA